MIKGLLPALCSAIELLNASGYRYSVIGGIAVSLWGRPRATYDIDIKVLVPECDYDVIRYFLRSRFPERARPHVRENPLIIDVLIEGVIVDFLLAIPGYEENIIGRAVSHKLGELLVQVSAAEDLIIQKAIAGRPRDWQDIEGILIEQYGKLDLSYTEEWLSQFAEVLENPLIFSHYDEIQRHISAIMTQGGHG